MPKCVRPFHGYEVARDSILVQCVEDGGPLGTVFVKLSKLCVCVEYCGPLTAVCVEDGGPNSHSCVWKMVDLACTAVCVEDCRPLTAVCGRWYTSPNSVHRRWKTAVHVKDGGPLAAVRACVCVCVWKMVDLSHAVSVEDGGQIFN